MAVFSWFTRAKARGVAAARAERERQALKYNAVEVIPRKDACCEAVQALAGQRYLCDEAPRLPLPDCDQPICDCTYRRHPDRRMDVRRATDLGFVVFSAMLHRDRNRRHPTVPDRRVAEQDRD